MLDGTPILDIKPYLSGVASDTLRRGWLTEAERRQSSLPARTVLRRAGTKSGDVSSSRPGPSSRTAGAPEDRGEPPVELASAGFGP
jgi:hypothetical protein